MDLNIKGLRSLYRMDSMVRYNPWPKLHNETVASHSYYVAMFTMLLCEQLQINNGIKLTALQIALVHDTPEIVINDITYDAKKRITGMEELLQPFEKEYVQDNFSFIHKQMFESYTHDDILARQIVEVADVMSVVQYCDNEARLGNQSFHELLIQSESRLNEEMKKLERMGYKCQRIII